MSWIIPVPYTRTTLHAIRGKSPDSEITTSTVSGALRKKSHFTLLLEMCAWKESTFTLELKERPLERITFHSRAEGKAFGKNHLSLPYWRKGPWKESPFTLELKERRLKKITFHSWAEGRTVGKKNLSLPYRGKGAWKESPFNFVLKNRRSERITFHFRTEGQALG